MQNPRDILSQLAGASRHPSRPGICLSRRDLDRRGQKTPDGKLGHHHTIGDITLRNTVNIKTGFVALALTVPLNRDYVSEAQESPVSLPAAVAPAESAAAQTNEALHHHPGAQYPHGETMSDAPPPPKWVPLIHAMCKAWEVLNLQDRDPRKIKIERLFSDKTLSALAGKNQSRWDLYVADLLRKNQAAMASYLSRREAIIKETTTKDVSVTFKITCSGSYTKGEFSRVPGDTMETMTQPEFRLQVIEGGEPKETVKGFFHLHFDENTDPPKLYSMSVYVPDTVYIHDAQAPGHSGHHNP